MRGAGFLFERLGAWGIVGMCIFVLVFGELKQEGG